MVPPPSAVMQPSMHTPTQSMLAPAGRQRRRHGLRR